MHVHRSSPLVAFDSCLTVAACLSSACSFAVSLASDLALLVGYVIGQKKMYLQSVVIVAGYICIQYVLQGLNVITFYTFNLDVTVILKDGKKSICIADTKRDVPQFSLMRVLLQKWLLHHFLTRPKI